MSASGNFSEKGEGDEEVDGDYGAASFLGDVSIRDDK